MIATETEDVTASLDHISGGTGVQIIFDPVGRPLLAHLLDAAAAYASVIIYGALSSDPTPLPLFALMGKRVTIRGSTCSR